MAGGKTPLELLTADPDRIPTFLTPVWAPALGGILGFSSMCFVNWGTRRPIFSGIQKHIIATATGALLAKWVDERRDRYLAERDAVLRHYIEIHPDDFPTPERKKFAEILLPWVPIR